MKYGLVFLLFLGSCFSVAGQEYLYNTNHFGLHSILLGGAVTAGNSDLSMVYYNPGALHYAEGEDIDVSLLMPRFEFATYRDYFREGTKTAELSLSLTSNLVSYRIKAAKNINVVLALLQKADWDNVVEYSFSQVDQELNEKESFSYVHRGRDYWAGAGTNFRLSKRINLGLSQFLSIASYRYSYAIRDGLFDTATNQFDPLFSRSLDLAFSNTLSFVTKLGLNIDLPKNRLGLVITTPHFSPIFQNGSFEKEHLDIDHSGTAYLAFSNFDLSPVIETPWKFSFGFSQLFGDSSRLWLDVSYFTTVDQYAIAEGRTVDGTSAMVSTSRRPLANISIGFTKKLNRNVELLGGLRTNFSAFVPSPIAVGQESVYILDDDRFHIVFGSNFHLNKKAITIGLDWGFTERPGNSILGQFIDLDRFETTNSNFTHNTINLIFTYGFLFNGSNGK